MNSKDVLIKIAPNANEYGYSSLWYKMFLVAGGLILAFALVSFAKSKKKEEEDGVGQLFSTFFGSLVFGCTSLIIGVVLSQKEQISAIVTALTILTVFNALLFVLSKNVKGFNRKTQPIAFLLLTLIVGCFSWFVNSALTLNISQQKIYKGVEKAYDLKIRESDNGAEAFNLKDFWATKNGQLIHCGGVKGEASDGWVKVTLECSDKNAILSPTLDKVNASV